MEVQETRGKRGECARARSQQALAKHAPTQHTALFNYGTNPLFLTSLLTGRIFFIGSFPPPPKRNLFPTLTSGAGCTVLARGNHPDHYLVDCRQVAWVRCSGNPASTLGSGGETPLETWARSTAWAATALHHCAKKLRSSLHSQHRAWFGKQIGVQGVLEPLSTWWGSSPLLLRVLSLSESNYVTRTHRTQQEQSAS